MAFKKVWPLSLALCVLACAPKEREYPRVDDVPGAYLNTYSAEVIDPETGETMGERTVRDTIFIKREGDYFQVYNRKWLLNDYDNLGWVDSLQGETIIKPYQAEYDMSTGLLSPLEKNRAQPLFLEDKKIYWGELRALEYKKVKSE